MRETDTDDGRQTNQEPITRHGREKEMNLKDKERGRGEGSSGINVK